MGYRSRERVTRLLAHKEPDRVPFDVFMCAEVRALLADMDLGREERECYTEGDFKYLEFRLEPDEETFAPYLPGLPSGAELSPWGVGRVRLKSVEGFSAGSRLYHPLADVNTVEELERFPFPDVTAPECHEHLDEAVGAAKRAGFGVVGQMSQTILETAYEMRGMERLFVDFHERPDYVKALFGSIAERRRFQARRFAEAGVDVLRIGDDIATQRALLVGPQTYRRWIKPFHADVVAAARRVNPQIPVLYHSDGALTALLPDLIEAGVTAINPVQPEAMSAREVKRAFGDRLTLWGCCGSQSVYAFGSEDDVVENVRALMRDVAPGGGFVLQFYNMLLTDRVMKNLRSFFRAFYELARYR
jgi:uroporphyrinogen decarboxylase